MDKKKAETQKQQVLKHLQDHGRISDREAYNLYGIRRLGARIYDLRHEGHDIDTTYEYGPARTGRDTHWAVYILSGCKVRPAKTWAELCEQAIKTSAQLEDFAENAKAGKDNTADITYVIKKRIEMLREMRTRLRAAADDEMDVDLMFDRYGLLKDWRAIVEDYDIPVQEILKRCNKMLRRIS